MPAEDTMNGASRSPASPEEDATRGWARDRFFRLAWLKTLGSVIAIGVFFVCYFYVMYNPVFTVREMPLTLVDRFCPVIEWTSWIYFSLWVYICLPLSLMRYPSELGVYLLGAVILSVLGLVSFVLYPTSVPAWPIDWQLYPSLAFLKEMELTGNACPSLHVAFSVFSALWGIRILRALDGAAAFSWGFGLWGLLIVLSTITTKQHVFWDLVFGLVYGGLAFGLNLRLASRIGWPTFARPVEAEAGP